MANYKSGKSRKKFRGEEICVNPKDFPPGKMQRSCGTCGWRTPEGIYCDKTGGVAIHVCEHWERWK